MGGFLAFLDPLLRPALVIEANEDRPTILEKANPPRRAGQFYGS
jgi:hypothetical protein